MENINAISDAISLLKSIGGDKNMQLLLENMEKAQKCNEQLLIDATTQRKEAVQIRDTTKATLKVVTQEKEEVTSKLNQLNGKTEKTLREISHREAVLNTKIAAFDTTSTELTKTLQQRDSDLIRRNSLLEKRETACREKEEKQKQVLAEWTEIENITSRMSAIIR